MANALLWLFIDIVRLGEVARGWNIDIAVASVRRQVADGGMRC